MQEKVNQQIFNEKNSGDSFYNITFNGLDLSGNRYVLNAEEATNDKNKPEQIFMKKVNAVFFFKDDTNLKIFADEGIYNNKTLDMHFKKNIKSFYQDSTLFAEKAEFSNSKGQLIVSDEIKLTDQNGTLNADKLFFDLKKQTLNISAFKNNKVNANIRVK